MARRLILLLIIAAAFVSIRGAAQDEAVAPDTVSARPATIRFEGLRDSVFLVVDRDFGRARVIAPGDAVSIPAGRRTIELFDHDSMSIWEDFPLRPGGVTTFRLKYRMPVRPRWSNVIPRLYWGANLLVVTDAASEIYVGDRHVGTGVAWLDTLPGRYTIVTRHATAGVKRRLEHVTDDRLTTLRMYTKPDQLTADVLTVIPGARQIYLGETFKGILLFGGSLVAWWSVGRNSNRYDAEVERFTNAQAWYRASKTEAEALAYGDAAAKAHEAAVAARDRRTRGVALGVGLFVAHVVDVLLSPALDARVTIALDPYVIPPGPIHADDVRWQMRWRIGKR